MKLGINWGMITQCVFFRNSDTVVIIEISYQKPLEMIDQYLSEHRAFLDDGYKKNYFVASGPQKPRTGGIIISHLNDRDFLEALLKKDPFYIHGLADYKFIEFEAVKYHPNFDFFVYSKNK